MILHLRVGSLAALTLFVAGTTCGQSAPAASPAASPAKHKPSLAVTVSTQQDVGQSGENLEDLLMIELANQPFLQLVDRHATQAVLKEHAIALANMTDTKNALALGKFAGADYLLHVLAERRRRRG